MSINSSFFTVMPQVSVAGLGGGTISAAAQMHAPVVEALEQPCVSDTIIIETRKDMNRLNTDFVFGCLKDGQVILIMRNGRLMPLKNRIFQIPNDGVHTKATDENGRVYSINTGEIPASGFYWGIVPRYFEKFGRRYDTSGDHNNVEIFKVVRGGTIRRLKTKEVREFAARHLGTSLPKFDNDHVKSISHGKSPQLRRKVVTKGGTVRLYGQEITISTGKFERKINIAVEASSEKRFKAIRQELIGILMNIPSALLSVVKRIEIYQWQSTLYDFDVSKEPIGGHYKHAGDILRIFNFSRLQEDDKPKVLHHELWHSLTFERDKAYVLLAIKAGGKDAKKVLQRYSEVSLAEHHQDSWAEYAATAGGMLLWLGEDSEHLMNGPGFIVSLLTYFAERSIDCVVREKRVDVEVKPA